MLVSPVPPSDATFSQFEEPLDEKAVTIRDLAEILNYARRDPLPELKISQHKGDCLHWHEKFEQFSFTVDLAAPLYSISANG